MKLPSLLLFFILSFFGLSAQDAAKFIVEIDQESITGKPSIPFSAIKIIDARFNQDDIGCVAKDFSLKGRTQDKMLAQFPKNPEAYLPNLLMQLVTPDRSSRDTLVILLKQLRIADFIPIPFERHQVPKSVLTIACSFFKAQHHQLWKIASLEKVQSQKWSLDFKIDKTDMIRQRGKALAALFSGLFSGLTWEAAPTAFTLAEMEEGLQKRFQFAFLTGQPLKAGVYKTYQEFQHNMPSVQEIKISRHKKEIKAVKDSRQNDINLGAVWGLCDGRDLYINFMGKLYRLQKTNNRYFLVFKRRVSEPLFSVNDEIPVGRNISIVRNSKRYALTLKDHFEPQKRPEALYLNLETGNIHIEEVVGTAGAESLILQR